MNRPMNGQGGVSRPSGPPSGMRYNSGDTGPAAGGVSRAAGMQQRQPAAPVNGGKGGGGSKKGLIAAIVSFVVVACVVLCIFLFKGDDDDTPSSTRGKNDVTTTKTTAEKTTESTEKTTRTTTEKTTEDTEKTTENTTEQPTVTAGEKTVMIYMIASDLESQGGLATSDLQEILDANVSANTKIVIQTGGTKKWHNNLCEDGKVQRFLVNGNKLIELDNLGKLSMVDGNNLKDFIKFANTNYPSDKNVLVLWNHGGNIPVSYGKDEVFPEKLMDASEIGQAITDSGVHFETIAFDACNTCTLEMAMALRNCADYMIAAESYVNGNGYYYTDWLKILDSSKAHEIEYAEQICRDYMKSIHQSNLTGSISVLQTKKIGEIYNAYLDYMKQVNKDVIEGNDYVGYTQARANCNSYQYMDTVDILTLANLYHNDYSTKLINSVVNSVEFTDSDFEAGHGIAVYSPFDYIESYSYARDMLLRLGYDQTIIGFYDSYCTLKVTYQGNQAAQDQGSDWYDQEMADDTVPEDQQTAQNYTLGTTTNAAGQTIVSIDYETLNILQNGEMTVTLISSDQTQALLLGSETNFLLDDDGNIVYAKPENWTHINDNPATYFSTSYYKDDSTGYWEEQAAVFAKVNGRDALIFMFCNQENPLGVLQGYAFCDNFDMDADLDYFAFNDDDTIDLVYIMIDVETSDVSYQANEEPFAFKDAKLSYSEIDLSGLNVMIGYTFTDVYGNKYEAESVLVE